MDTALAAVIIAGMALAATIITNIFGSGWKVSGRLTSIESESQATQISVEASRQDTSKRLDAIQEETKKISEVLISLAEMRGDYNLLNQRITTVERRQALTDELVDNLRRGRGWIGRERGSIDGEYP